MHMRLFLELFLLFWSPWHWTMTHKSSKLEKHLQSISKLVYSSICLHWFITLLSVKPLGLQRKHGGEILFTKSFSTHHAPSRWGRSHEGFGNTPPLPTPEKQSLYRLMEHIPSDGNSLPYLCLPVSAPTTGYKEQLKQANLACFKSYIKSVGFFLPCSSEMRLTYGGSM